MFNTYNMGIGMVMALAPEEADQAVRAVESAGEKAYVIGMVQSGDRCAEIV
jgi:phosphoribosylformylglycinamidine cyclo-ligase